MTRNRQQSIKKYWQTVLFIVTISILIYTFWIKIQAEASNTITVIATVRPMRILVVDDSHIIQKVASNTALDTRPMVVLNTLDGVEIPYTSDIARDYESLKRNLNFSKPGIIYDGPKPTSLWQTLTTWLLP